MVKVLLIQPRRSNSDGRKCMPVGLASIAADLIKDHHEVEIVDCEIQTLLYRSVSVADFIGISVNMSFQEESAKRIIKFCRKVNPKAKIIIGGNQATFSSELHSLVDFVVQGEGEFGMWWAINFWRTESKIIETTPVNIEKLTFPAYYLLDMNRYFKINKPETLYTKNKRVIQYETSRGCGFKCDFCSSKNFWGDWRGKSVSKVRGEILRLVMNYNADELDLIDANLLFSKSRSLKLFKMWARWFPDIAWSNPGGIWIGGLSEKLLDYMKLSGCYQLTFPVETTNKKILKKYHIFKVNLDHTKKMAKYCNKIGIPIHGFFIAGFREQTYKDIQDDYDFAKAMDFESVSFHLLTKFPGTDIESVNLSYYESKYKELENYIRKLNDSYNKSLIWRHPIRYFKKYVWRR